MDSRTGPRVNTFGWRPWLAAVLAGAFAIGAEQTFEHFEERSQLEHEQIHVLHKLSQLRARLESVINGNLLLTHGLTAVIAAQPDIDQKGFAQIARNLVDERHALRNIAGAPGMVISLIYPVEGNEAALGLDFRTHPIQRETAMRAVETRESVIAGPLELAQGGMAIIAREPVFLLPTEEGGARSLWGLVSAVIDIDKMYGHAGLSRDGRYSDLAIAIRGKDGKGARGDTFLGDPMLFSQNPMTIMVTLPGGSWQLAAIPAWGWGQHDHNVDLIRVAGFTVALILALMAFLLARDIDQRRVAEQELRASTERLKAAESIAHIGNWEYRVADGSIEWSDEVYRIFGLSPQQRPIDYDWLRSQVHPDDRADHDEYLQRLLGSHPGETTPEYQYRFTRKDGTQRTASIWVKIDYDQDHKPCRLFGTLQDVTDTRQMQLELQSRLNELTRWQGVILAREERVQELKMEVNQLLTERGEPIRYPSQEDAS